MSFHHFIRHIPILTFSIFLPVALSANPTQIAFLDHAYTVLDKATIKELDESDFLKRFAFYEVISHSEKEGVRIARYLTGRSTYIELYAEGERDGTKVGLGIMSESPGDIDIIKNRLSQESVAFKSSLMTRNLGEEEVNFLQDLALGDDEVDLWAAEYISSYMNNPLSQREPAEHENDQISRERYLPDGYQQHQFRDIQKVVIELDPSHAASLISLLKAAGYNVNRGGNTFSATGERDAIEVISKEDGKGRIREIHMLLNDPVKGKHVEAIGNTSLTVGPGRSAVWVLND
ncbi:DUF5829 family protein [Microbulbifer guangxiensis]|uniref:DUF5829 family protein n=1 Tax=Microbulbifer guangxiensis TaxID=2904249 RepID=UPI001F220CC4|nr:DUF5829 family protein [Microbulbifer guangxiensis]